MDAYGARYKKGSACYLPAWLCALHKKIMINMTIEIIGEC